MTTRNSVLKDLIQLIFDYERELQRRAERSIFDETEVDTEDFGLITGEEVVEDVLSRFNGQRFSVMVPFEGYFIKTTYGAIRERLPRERVYDVKVPYLEYGYNRWEGATRVHRKGRIFIIPAGGGS